MMKPFRLLALVSILLMPAFLQAQSTTLYISGPEVLCAGECATYTANYGNTPNDPPATYTWTLNGPGGSIASGANTKNPVVCFFAGGIYTLSVVVTGPNGTVSQASFTIFVDFAIPPYIYNTAPANCDSTGINPNGCEKVCPYTTQTYTTNTSGGVSGGAIWTVQGALSYSSDPQTGILTVNWGAPGSGIIIVNTVGATACPASSEKCITIIEAPEAHIGANPAPGATDTLDICMGQTVWFDNLSLNADTYLWNFGDGAVTETNAAPQHTFQTPGTYTVQLIAMSLCMCADTTELVVRVQSAESQLPDCTGTVCAGTTVTYTANSNCGAYNWNISANGTVLAGGGANDNSVTIQWQSGPAGEIELLATACSAASCPSPSLTRIPVIDDNAEIKGPERVCPGTQELYRIEAFQGTGFQWSLSGGGTILEGQGTNRVLIEWANAPNPNFVYKLSVSYDNCYLGCGGKDTLDVHILSPMVVDGPVEICELASGLFSAKLTANSQNINCNWEAIGPAGTAIWSGTGPTANLNFNAGAGYYRIFATPVDPTQTCSTQADWAVSAAAQPSPPTSIGGTSNICPGTALTYEAEGLTPNAIVQWTIQNGPGAPSQPYGNPTVVSWGATPPYGLSVVAISNQGLFCPSQAVSIAPLAFNPAYASILGPDSICINSSAHFYATGVDGLPLQWTVPSGAGAITGNDNTSQADIFWSVAGTYTIQLYVCTQSISRQIVVLPTPTPMAVAPTGLCEGSLANVTLSQMYASYNWLSENGASMSTLANLDLGPGHYTVEVSSDFGCVGKSNFSISGYPNPNVSLTTTDPTGFCNNSRTVTMRALASNSGSYMYQWFQDGNPVGGNSPIYSTNQYGQYTVQVSNSFGCSDTGNPILIFEDCTGGGQCSGLPGHASLPCPPGTISINVMPTARCDSFALSINPDPNYVAGSASWYFGISGGALLGTANGDNVHFIGPNAGGYIALIQALRTDGSVCEAADSMFVEAVARFDTLPACAGSLTQFEDISAFMPNSGINSWAWNFGDPASGGANTASSAYETHVYANGGNYQVQLSISALSGCTSTSSILLPIPDGGLASITPPGIRCENTAVLLTASVSPDIISMHWNFDDPASGIANTATGDTAYHVFPSGTYNINLQTTTNRGCVANTLLPFTTAPNTLSGTITPAVPAPVCEGQTITLLAPAGGISYLWSDSITNSTQFPIGIEGVYSVTLTDANGCTYSPPPVEININPAPEGQIKAILQNDLGQTIGTAYGSLSICAGDDVRLKAFGLGAYNYHWSNGFNGSNIEFSNAHFNTLAVGSYTYTVTVTDPVSGCTAVSDPFTVEVNPVPSGINVQINNSPPCAGSTNALTYTGPQMANWQYQWNNGQTGYSILTETPGVYSIRVTNEFGCSAKSNEVTVLPGPNINTLPSGCHTRCKPDSLCFPTLPGIVSWQWYQDGNPIPGAQTGSFVAQQSGAYWAVLTDVYGCTAQSGSLNLDLYDGFGSIFGEVWSDVNHNGIIDANDTLMSGIPVLLLQNTIQQGSSNSGSNGNFAFTNILSTNYLVSVDTQALLPGWTGIIATQSADLLGCDDETQVAFLLDFHCVPAQNNLQLSTCQGDSVQYNSQWLQAGSTQSFTFTTANCDSVVTVQVLALPTSAATLNVATCAGESYDYNGALIPAGQSQIFVLTNAQGCDSVLTVQVATLPSSAATLHVATCAGENYDYNGALIPAGQSQTFVLTNAQGCDSVLTVQVATLPSSAATLNVATCAGENYDYNGALIPAGQSQTFVLTNAQGCDSVLSVQVGILPVYNQTQTVYVCPDSFYVYNGVLIGPGETQSFSFQSQEACDSIVTIQVLSYPSLSFGLTVDSSCFQSPNGAIAVDGLSGGTSPFRYSIDGQNFQPLPIFTEVGHGSYTVYVADNNHCVFQQETLVPYFPPLLLELEDATLACGDESVLLSPIVGGDSTQLSFQWWNGATTPSVLATETGPVWVEAHNRCETLHAEANVSWADLPDRSFVYVPNVFTPNATLPENHIFRPYFYEGILLHSFEMDVYDRWGNHLFHTDAPENGWIGPFRGESMQPGVFVWYLVAEIEYCGRLQTIRKKGDVTILR